MVAGLDEARHVASIDPEESSRLTSSQRPIVLLVKRPGACISTGVAPGNPRIGVLLPYTPLHHLLFRPVPGAAASRRPACW